MKAFVFATNSPRFSFSLQSPVTHTGGKHPGKQITANETGIDSITAHTPSHCNCTAGLPVGKSMARTQPQQGCMPFVLVPIQQTRTWHLFLFAKAVHPTTHTSKSAHTKCAVTRRRLANTLPMQHVRSRQHTPSAQTPSRRPAETLPGHRPLAAMSQYLQAVVAMHSHAHTLCGVFPRLMMVSPLKNLQVYTHHICTIYAPCTCVNILIVR